MSNEIRKFRNTNERWGECIDIEAVSKDAIADEMMPILRSWADDQDRDVAELRAEFISDLEEVEG